MARDIEEFLRKAAERRNKKQSENQAAQPAPSQPQRQVTQQPIPQPQPLAPSIRQQQSSVPESEIEVLHHESLGAHIQRHLDTSDITQHAQELAKHAQSLGSEVGMADEKIESHLHKKFEHEVGRLGQEAARESQQGQGSSLLQLLRSPKTIRQAIVISEILKRPEY